MNTTMAEKPPSMVASSNNEVTSSSSSNTALLLKLKSFPKKSPLLPTPSEFTDVSCDINKEASSHSKPLTSLPSNHHLSQPTTSKQEPEPVTTTTSSCDQSNLITNYLPPHMSQDDVRSLFQTIAPLDNCKLVRDKFTGQSLGYAFVKYKRKEDAERAIQVLNGLQVMNKVIKVSKARPSSQKIREANLFVSGLLPHVQNSDLNEVFKPYGDIISVRILTDKKTDLSRGVAFVRFNLREEAERAVNALNGNEILGSNLSVKFAVQPSNHPINNTSNKNLSSRNCDENRKKFKKIKKSEKETVNRKRNQSTPSTIKSQQCFMHPSIEKCSGMKRKKQNLSFSAAEYPNSYDQVTGVLSPKTQQTPLLPTYHSYLDFNLSHIPQHKDLIYTHGEQKAYQQTHSLYLPQIFLPSVEASYLVRNSLPVFINIDSSNFI